jgi:hypothetical protein
MRISELYATMEKPCISVYDKTGNISLGHFYGEQPLPPYFRFVEVLNFSACCDSIHIKAKDFTGELKTKNDDISVYAVGFDYEKGKDFFDPFTPAYINIKVKHYARCEETVKKLKLTPEFTLGYSFKLYGKKYYLSDFIH